MLQDVPAPPSGASSSLPVIVVDKCTQLVPPTIGCLRGLTTIADEVSERWITPRPDREVMTRWLGRVIERNDDGQIARFCIHREAQCAGVVGFSCLDPVRLSWWVGPQWRGTGLAEAACRAVLAWLGTTQEVTVVEAIIDPDNHASMALANRLGFHDAGSITKHQPDRSDSIKRRRLALEL